jgi:hypothetical protein
MSQPEVDKFATKVSRTLEDFVIDKRARAARKRIADPERRFHEGFAEGLSRAINEIRRIAREW